MATQIYSISNIDEVEWAETIYLSLEVIGMNPIKPIERILKAGEGQPSVLVDVVRERYWKQKAQETPPVEASEEADELTQKQQKHEEDNSPVQTQRTYAEFEINQDTREVSVRIIDASSGDLIRTIPADKLAEEIVKGNLHPNQLRHRGVLV